MTITDQIFPDPDSQGIQLFSQGGRAQVERPDSLETPIHLEVATGMNLDSLASVARVKVSVRSQAAHSLGNLPS